MAQMNRQIPWKKWDELSNKARFMDHWGKGCGHSLKNLAKLLNCDENLLRKSNLVFLCAISCQEFDNCQAIDEWRWHQDFLTVRKFEPPMIRPVNFRNALVINQKGQIMGPLSHEEWLIHGQKMLDVFFEIQKGD